VSEDGLWKLGVDAEGTPVYYDADRHSRVDGHAESESVAREDGVSLEQSTSVGQLIREIEDDVGWDELSDYARDRAPEEGLDTEADIGRKGSPDEDDGAD
jgi:hypothetical protein